jgi:hypothetical protein
MGIANYRLPASLGCLVGTALFKHAMQILTVGTDRAAFWERAWLFARATLIATAGKSAFAVKRAEFACNVPQLVLAAAALPVTTLNAACAEQYVPVALSSTSDVRAACGASYIRMGPAHASDHKLNRRLMIWPRLHSMVLSHGWNDAN